MVLNLLGCYLHRCSQFVNMFAFYVCYTSIESLQKHAHPHIHTKTSPFMFLVPRGSISKPSGTAHFSVIWPSPAGHLLPTCAMCAIHTGALLILLTLRGALAFALPSAWNSSRSPENATSYVRLPLISQTKQIPPAVAFPGMLLFPLSWLLALCACMCFLDWR